MDTEIPQFALDLDDARVNYDRAKFELTRVSAEFDTALYAYSKDLESNPKELGIYTDGFDYVIAMSVLDAICLAATHYGKSASTYSRDYAPVKSWDRLTGRITLYTTRYQPLIQNAEE